MAEQRDLWRDTLQLLFDWCCSQDEADTILWAYCLGKYGLSDLADASEEQIAETCNFFKSYLAALCESSGEEE